MLGNKSKLAVGNHANATFHSDGKVILEKSASISVLDHSVFATSAAFTLDDHASFTVEKYAQVIFGKNAVVRMRSASQMLIGSLGNVSIAARAVLGLYPGASVTCSFMSYFAVTTDTVIYVASTGSISVGRNSSLTIDLPQKFCMVSSAVSVSDNTVVTWHNTVSSISCFDSFTGMLEVLE